MLPSSDSSAPRLKGSKAASQDQNVLKDTGAGAGAGAGAEAGS